MPRFDYTKNLLTDFQEILEAMADGEHRPLEPSELRYAKEVLRACFDVVEFAADMSNTDLDDEGAFVKVSDRIDEVMDFLQASAKAAS